MTEQINPEPPSVEPPLEAVVVTTRLQRFVIKHPVLARWILIGLTAGTATGAAVTANTVKKNSHHVDAAKEHMLEAGHEISAAVSPTSTETPA